MTPAQKLVPVRLIVFASPGTVPLEVARARGLFAAEGLAVSVEATPSSMYQMAHLIDGDFEIAATAIDNVVAYMEGQGAAPTTRPADLRVFMGSATYRNAFVVVPSIRSWDDLRGKKIAVDALSTGYAFLLRKMLADNGLTEDDYVFESIGAPAQRWAAVKAGTHVGALLTDELTEIAVRAGYHAMTSDPDPWDNYQGNAYVARRDWAEAHRPQLTGFVRAFLRAVRWTLDPANADALPALLRQHLPSLGEEQAAAAARALQRPKSILTPDMPLNISGIRTVLALRGRYGTPRKALDDPFRYVDLSYYEAARTSLAQAQEAGQ